MVGSSRVITLNTDDKVAVGCLGPGNYIRATGMQLAPATCTATSKLLLVDGQELSYSQLGCLSQNKEILLENGTCANGPGTVIRIGWQAGPEFIPLYDTCHDKAAAANYFSTQPSPESSARPVWPPSTSSAAAKSSCLGDTWHLTVISSTPEVRTPLITS